MPISKRTLVERHKLLPRAMWAESALIDFANIHNNSMGAGPGGVNTGEYTQEDPDTNGHLHVDVSGKPGDVTEASFEIYHKDAYGRMHSFDATLGRVAIRDEDGEETGSILSLSGSTIAQDPNPIVIYTGSREVRIPNGVGNKRIENAAKAMALFTLLAEHLK